MEHNATDIRSTVKDGLVGDRDDWQIAKQLGAAHERHLEVQVLALLVALLVCTKGLLAVNSSLHHTLEHDAQGLVAMLHCTLKASLGELS